VYWWVKPTTAGRGHHPCGRMLFCQAYGKPLAEPTGEPSPTMLDPSMVSGDYKAAECWELCMVQRMIPLRVKTNTVSGNGQNNKKFTTCL